MSIILVILERFFIMLRILIDILISYLYYLNNYITNLLLDDYVSSSDDEAKEGLVKFLIIGLRYNY